MPGCGFIGFEPRGADGGADPLDMDSGLDASTLDASQQVPAHDAASVLDASLVDASLSDASLPDASLDAALVDASSQPSDASAADAGRDAQLADAALPGDAAQPVDAGSDAGSGPATQVTDYCAQLPALPAEPVIDGLVDASLNLVTITPVGWTSNGNAPLPDNPQASFAMAFRPDGLYAYVRVIDANRLPPPEDQQIWHGDGVELYVDHDATYSGVPYDNPGAVQIIAAAPTTAVDSAQRAVRFRDAVNLGAWSSTRFATFPTVDGYVLEAFVDAASLDLPSWSLATGAQVGIDLGINLSAADGELDAGIFLDGYRIGQYFLSVTTGGSCDGRPFCNALAFCNPVLVE